MPALAFIQSIHHWMTNDLGWLFLIFVFSGRPMARLARMLPLWFNCAWQPKRARNLFSNLMVWHAFLRWNRQ